MKKKLYTTILVCLFTLGAFAQNVLYLTRGNEYADAEAIMATKMGEWGYTVTTVDALPSTDPNDYATYDLCVVSEAVSSGDVNEFSAAGYPIPIVNFEGYTPRSDRWGWFETAAQQDEYWFQIRNDNADDADKPKIDYAYIDVMNASHELWQAVGVACNDGDSVKWSATDDATDLEVVYMDLVGAEIVEGTALATYNNRENSYTMWAIEPGALEADNDYRIFMWGLNANALNDAAGLFYTDAFWAILEQSMAWVQEETLPNNCSSIDQLTISNANLRIYPSPAVGITKIRLHLNEFASGTVRIIDVTGNILFEITDNFEAGANIIEFDADKLASGVYFVEARILGESTAVKFVK